MTAKRLDGKRLAAEMRQEIAARVAKTTATLGRAPCLAAVLIGQDPASQVYVRNKERACANCGIDSRLHRLPGDASQTQLLDLIDELNRDTGVDGVLVQLPLPQQMDSKRILDAVHPAKDVDCFHPENVGLLMQGRPRFLPCTPHGCLQLLERHQVACAGKRVAVVGRSEIVGKPLAAMLMQRRLAPLRDETVNATVVCCHSRTTDLGAVLREAEIVIAAVGQPRMITADMLRPEAVVVDVGINRVEGALVGDVDYDAAREVASWITPVPGGVGPLTVTMLLFNTLAAAEHAGR